MSSKAKSLKRNHLCFIGEPSDGVLTMLFLRLMELILLYASPSIHGPGFGAHYVVEYLTSVGNRRS